MSSKTKTTAMKEDAKPALVPKLRFPEFRKADRWEEKRLGEVASFFKGKGISKAEIATNGRRPCIRYGELYTRYGEVIDKVFSRTDADDAELFFSRSNDVIIPGSGETKLDIAKASCVMHDDVALGGDLNVIRTKHNGVFLSYYFNGPKKRDIAMVAQGDTVVHLYPSQLEKLAIALPKDAEQQKIASCLSSVDELIAAQARKLDSLKTHKKGLMQQLFPREGESLPRLRFPEFKNKGVWEVKTMGSFASFSSGGTPSKDNPAYWNGSIPWISASSMYDLIIEKADHYVTPLAIGSGTRIAKKGSILILVRGSMLFKRVPICVAGIDVAFNQDVKALDVDASINTSFLLYQLSAFQSRIPINETGIGAGKIELEHLKEFELFFPEGPEQHRIADCLTSLDDLIAAQTQKLTALKTHKKGLMQQLFPSPEEVAGRNPIKP